MLDMIAALFGSATDKVENSEPTGRLALAALLVEAACQDDVFGAEERAVITRILASEFELDDAGAAALLSEAEAAQDGSVGVFRFIQALKAETAFEERAGILEHLWAVVLADGTREATENALLRKVSGLLGVPDRESALARQRVEARM